jgi:hypothetical protein
VYTLSEPQFQNVKRKVHINSQPKKALCIVALVWALNVAELRAVVANVISLCSQISQELNQVLGNMNTVAPSQQNGDAHVTNGDSTQAQQVCTYYNSHVSSSITNTVVFGNSKVFCVSAAAYYGQFE